MCQCSEEGLVSCNDFKESVNIELKKTYKFYYTSGVWRTFFKAFGHAYAGEHEIKILKIKGGITSVIK